MSKERAKGTKWESEIVAALQRAGFAYVERRAHHGSADRGDIAGLPDFCIEAKSQSRQTLAEWLDEAKVEARNAAAPFGVVWFKRRGKARAEDGYVLMDGATFITLIEIVTNYGSL